jgi:hypothetical protein
MLLNNEVRLVAMRKVRPRYMGASWTSLVPVESDQDAAWENGITAELEKRGDELLARIAEQQSVETAFAMEEATDEEMFAATAAVYAAATRFRRALPDLSSDT